jgi:hypothetical protein
MPTANKLVQNSEVSPQPNNAIVRQCVPNGQLDQTPSCESVNVGQSQVGPTANTPMPLLRDYVTISQC